MSDCHNRPSSRNARPEGGVIAGWRVIIVIFFIPFHVVVAHTRRTKTFISTSSRPHRPTEIYFRLNNNDGRRG